MKHSFAPHILLSLALTLAATSSVRAQAAPANPVPDAAEAESAPLAPGDSHVRIVRLSEVRGAVQLDRNTGGGFEATMQNMPIVEGARLRTADGFAEVEFEDNTTLRLAPNSLVEFPRLILHATGVHASTINLKKGLAYVSLSREKTNDFTVNLADRTLSVAPSTHLRLEMDDTKAEIAVLQGTATVAGSSVTTQVNKKQTLTLDLAGAAPPIMTGKVVSGRYDEWDRQALSYQKSYARNNALLNSPYRYGISDLNYYGSFANLAGCGTMWRPYLTSAGWDPYANGLWAWYPGAGYSWVSPYPWGWTPFHYGSWQFCPGSGWGWTPGGQWRSLNNQPAGVAASTIHAPRPPNPPMPGHATLVVTNRTPLVVSRLNSSSDSFVFTRNSAGLGVPRGSLGNLNKLSNSVEQHGFATRPVYSAAPTPTGPHPQSTLSAPMSLRQGQAPPSISRTEAPSIQHGSPSFSPSTPASAPAPVSHSAPSSPGGSNSSSHK
jgi:FecR protein